MKIINIFIIITLMMVTYINAEILCDTQYIVINYNQSETTTKTFHCTNQINQTVNLTKSGDYFTINSNNFLPNESKDIIITLDPNAPIGLHQGQIFFSDNSNTIQLFFNTQLKTQQQTGCTIDIFPLSMSGIKISQGDKKTRSIQISIPSCYNTTVNVKSLSLQTDEKPIQLSEVNLGILQPGSSLLIPIEIDANGVATGQYSDILSFLIYDVNGNKINVPIVSISVLVTAGISPISNYSFSQLPSCSLNSLVLAVNNTYTLTCSINNPNFLIRPKIDNEFLKGVGVTQTSTQYIYEFSPIKIGETLFCADYVYQQSSIGLPYCVSVKITPSGVSTGGGINLRAEFYQSGIKKDINKLSIGEVIILAVDNSTNNIVHPKNIFINGVISNNTINLESSKYYEVRIEVDGYMNLILSNLSISELPIDCNIINPKDIYETGDSIIFNSSIENITYLANDVKIYIPFIPYQSGNITIKCVKENYITKNFTINIIPSVSLGSCTPQISDWKKGSNIICSLSKITPWEVINNGSIINSGNSDKIEFKISKGGELTIKSNQKIIQSIIIEDSSIFNWIFKNWIISSIGGIILLGFIIIIIRNYNKNKTSPQPDYS